MTDQWGAIYELAAMGEDEMEPTSYSAKMHRQDPESWAERAEAKAVAAAMAEVFRIADGWRIVSGPALPLPMNEAYDTGPAAENIAAAFEGRLK